MIPVWYVEELLTYKAIHREDLTKYVSYNTYKPFVHLSIRHKP